MRIALRVSALIIMALCQTAIAQNNEQMKTMMQEMQKVMANCNLDQICIYETIEKRSLDNKDPLQAFWAQELIAANERISKEQLLDLEKQCRSDELLQARNAIAQCLKEININDGNLTAKLQESFTKKLTPLAKQNNIYAINALANLQGNEQWQQKLESLKDSEAYQLLLQCTE